jgi:hypothetical protein
MQDAPRCSVVIAEGLTKLFGEFTAVDRVSFDIARRERDFRPDRPQRRREEHRHQDADDPSSAHVQITVSWRR